MSANRTCFSAQNFTSISAKSHSRCARLSHPCALSISSYAIDPAVQTSSYVFEGRPISFLSRFASLSSIITPIDPSGSSMSLCLVPRPSLSKFHISIDRSHPPQIHRPYRRYPIQFPKHISHIPSPISKSTQTGTQTPPPSPPNPNPPRNNQEETNQNLHPHHER